MRHLMNITRKYQFLWRRLTTKGINLYNFWESVLIPLISLKLCDYFSLSCQYFLYVLDFFFQIRDFFFFIFLIVSFNGKMFLNFIKSNLPVFFLWLWFFVCVLRIPCLTKCLKDVPPKFSSGIFYSLVFIFRSMTQFEFIFVWHVS